MISMVNTHVDDLLQCSSTDCLIDELYNGLMAAYGTITFHAEIQSYIGMSIKQSSDRSTFTVSMKGAVSALLEKHLDPRAKPAPTPACADLFDEPTDKTPVMDFRKFLSIIMAAMYIARLVKPEMLLPLAYLATRAQNVTKSDVKKVSRALRYMKGSQDDVLVIRCEDLTLRGHIDASFGSHPNGRSHTGIVVSMGKTHSYVHAKSSKQKIGSFSVTEAEINALVDGIKLLLWLRNLLAELNVTRQQPAIVYQDNQSVLLLVNGPDTKVRRVKHILTKIIAARDVVTQGYIKPIYCPTELMTSDILTKPVQGESFVVNKFKIIGKVYIYSNI